MLYRQFGWHFDFVAHLGCSRSNHFTPESMVLLDHPIQWLAFFFRAKVSCNLPEFVWTNLQGSSWQHCQSEDWNNCKAPWLVFLDAKIVVSADGCWLNWELASHTLWVFYLGRLHMESPGSWVVSLYTSLPSSRRSSHLARSIWRICRLF